MKIHSIIANTISEEILQTGHLSIRLLADGFSLLLEDKSYKPVVLLKATSDQTVSLTASQAACEDWLNRHTLLEHFSGECTILPGSQCETIVPEEIFSVEDSVHYISSVSEINPSDSVLHKLVPNRPFVIVYAVRETVKNFSEKFHGNCRIISDTEVLISVADQVNAADHQRGFVLMEVQHKALSIILIKNDFVQLINHLDIKDEGDLVYHILNILKQMDFDRKSAPLYFAGKLPVETAATLNRYIKNIHPLAYVIQDIDKTSILENILIAEATKCG
ncbi:DUF3822 family protein [Bacteroidota bacterium]